MFACFVFVFPILYFICILLLLLPTWRIKPDDDDNYQLSIYLFIFLCVFSRISDCMCVQTAVCCVPSFVC